MSKDFKIGDRVRVYGGGDKHGNANTDTGTVKEVLPNGFMRIAFDGRDDYFASGCTYQPQQCRRLVKRPRRRVWVNMAEMKNVLSLTNWDRKRLLDFGKPTNTDGWVEFVESRKPAKKGRANE